MKTKVPAVIELVTCGALDRSYTHCAVPGNSKWIVWFTDNVYFEMPGVLISFFKYLDTQTLRRDKKVRKTKHIL